MEKSNVVFWKETSKELPKENTIVETKLEEKDISRKTIVKLARKGNLWFREDMSMYVYYTPTHWRYILCD